MNKTTRLMNAIEALSGLLDSDLSAAQPWKDEIQALNEAAQAMNKETPVFVCVRGGCVTLVADETGEPHPFPVVIDYDGQDDTCPVCGDDLEGKPCEQCGYDPQQDNALEAAVKYYSA